MSTPVKQVKKHIPMTVLAAAAVKRGTGFTINDLMSDGFPRCTVQRGIRDGVLKVKNDSIKTGERGRPAQALTPTLKARSLAKKVVVSA